MSSIAKSQGAEAPIRTSGAGKSARRLAARAAVLFVLASCTGGKPEPIHFGGDSCQHCKMLIVDKRFGGEIVTGKGKVFKFDSLECMHRFERGGSPALGGDFARYVVDSAGEGALIPAESASFVELPGLRGPMGRAFFAADSAEKLEALVKKQESKGAAAAPPPLRWSQLAPGLGP